MGNWRIENNGNDVPARYIADQENLLICLAPEGYPASIQKWDVNAKLIAAAPHMLKVLEALIPAIEGDEELWFEYEMVLNAIKKATQ